MNSFTFSNIGFAPALISAIRKYKDYFDNSVIAFCESLYLPRSMADIDTFCRVIDDIFNDKLQTPEDYIPKDKRVYESYETDEIWSKSAEELEKESDELSKELGLDDDVSFDEWLNNLNSEKGE